MKQAQIDKIDIRLLRAIQSNGRISNVDLAESIHLSAPQSLRRLRALEERGVIRGYSAQIDGAKVGLGVIAFVGITLDREEFQKARELERSIRQFPEILECHAISGDIDYLLRVAAHDLKGLSQFLTDRLMHIKGIATVRSMISMEEIKPISPLALDEQLLDRN